MNAGPTPRMTVIESGIEEGIEWATCAAPMYGAVNGYVKLPEGHPWSGLELQMGDGPDIDAPGGITYGPTDSGWIGFDTLHSGDYWPGAPRYYEDLLHGTNWTPEMVTEETRKLARQVAAVNS